MADYMISQAQLTTLGDSFRRNIGGSANYSWNDLLTFSSNGSIRNGDYLTYLEQKQLRAEGCEGFGGSDSKETNQDGGYARLSAECIVYVSDTIASFCESRSDWLDYIHLPSLETLYYVNWTVGNTSGQVDLNTLEENGVTVYDSGWRYDSATKTLRYFEDVGLEYIGDAYKVFNLEIGVPDLNNWYWITVLEPQYSGDSVYDYDGYFTPYCFNGSYDDLPTEPIESYYYTNVGESGSDMMPLKESQHT